MIEKCPVCNGKGTVPEWFYDTIRYNGKQMDNKPDNTCRTCKGAGIVSEKDLGTCIKMPS